MLELLQRRREVSPIEGDWSSPIAELDDEESRMDNLLHQMDAANQVGLSMLSGRFFRFLHLMHPCIPRSLTHVRSLTSSLCVSLSVFHECGLIPAAEYCELMLRTVACRRTIQTIHSSYGILLAIFIKHR